MKKRKSKHRAEPIGKIKIVDDFLPKPEDLVLREETVKVTISLTKSSVNFFKNEAAKQRANYQAMIRTLVDQYADRFLTKRHHKSL